jgi:acetyl esterase/lipase
MIPSFAWVYFALSLLGLAMATTAVLPIYRPATLAMGNFFVGWLSRELASQQILLQAIVSAFFLAHGVFDYWPGKVAVAITLSCWVTLSYAIVQAIRTRNVLDLALQETLGQDFLQKIPALWQTQRRGYLQWLRVFRVFPIRRRDVEKVSGIVYRKVGDKSLKLDVYHSVEQQGPGQSDGEKKRPTIIYIHGGGWVIGNRGQQGLPTLNHLAANGWICFTINYRLSPRATFPDHIIDVKHAIAWVKEHGHEFGADTDFITLVGGSAGGHLAALAALSPNDPNFQPGFEDVDTTVQGCVPLYGIFDLQDSEDNWPHRGLKTLMAKQVIKKTIAEAQEIYEQGSPISRITKDAPPFFLLHGDQDTLVPIKESRRFVEAFKEGAEASIVLGELPGGQHAFEVFPSIRTAYAVEAIEEFCAAIYGRHLGR